MSEWCLSAVEKEDNPDLALTLQQPAAIQINTNLSDFI
jgi:hypothetical protein